MVNQLRKTSLLRRIVMSWCISVPLMACTSGVSFDARRARFDAVIEQAQWQTQTLNAGAFTLMTAAPRTPAPSALLSIYIEGDGLAWVDSHTPALNPSPMQALVLQLATQHPNTQVAYLARPCQYVEGRACQSPQYWTSHRFAPEVVHALNQAVDQLKVERQAKAVELIGYSGGGALALLIAAQRSDVQRIGTLAGNLDTAAWTAGHRITPLWGSQNPADVAAQTRMIPQVHWMGLKDIDVPPSVARAYEARLNALGPHAARFVPVADFDHACCWLPAWPRLYLEQR